MDLSFRPLLCSRAFRNIPKDHDASQASHIAKDHHENTVADNEANAPIDYQHLREFRRKKWARRKLAPRRERNWFAEQLVQPNDDATTSASCFANHLTLRAQGKVLYEYHV